MTVSDPQVIDIVSTSSDGQECVLRIVDHLPWGEPEHLLSLQDKINSYLAFLESGEVQTEYPEAEGKRCHILVVCMNEPDELAVDFLRIAGDAVRGAGFEFSWETSSA